MLMMPSPINCLCRISYVQEAIEAEHRLRAGHRQLYCAACGHWVWPEECEHEGRLADGEFRRLT